MTVSPCSCMHVRIVSVEMWTVWSWDKLVDMDGGQRTGIQSSTTDCTHVFACRMEGEDFRDSEVEADSDHEDHEDHVLHYQMDNSHPLHFHTVSQRHVDRSQSVVLYRHTVYMTIFNDSTSAHNICRSVSL